MFTNMEKEIRGRIQAKTQCFKYKNKVNQENKNHTKFRNNSKYKYNINQKNKIIVAIIEHFV